MHTDTFGGLEWPTHDTIITLANGVDGSVRQIRWSYEVRGLVENVTSYSDAAGTNVVNQVQNGYNDFAQLSVQYQEHDGAVDTGTTPKVQYGYAVGSANTIRPTSMTYPNGRVLEYEYSDEAADKLSRLDLLVVDEEDVAAFGYLGLGTFIRTEYLPPGVRYDLANGTGANRYAGMDRFSHIIDLTWRKAVTGSSSSSSNSSNDASALVHLQYDYDRSSNRTYRRDEVARSYGKAFDELYAYDDLNQLKKFHRGLLSDDNRVITSPELQQAWQFDATGNWKNFVQFDPADGAKTLDQQRQHNAANEITDISRTVGAAWATPTYDRNGNMLSDEVGRQYTYDAWNRLVTVKDTEGTSLAAYAYDGQRWRIAETHNGVVKELYYSTQWQVLEERIDGEVVLQYVWGPQYVDELILRDRATTTPGILNEQIWALQDANWNVVALVDGGGEVVERYGYTPFGLSQVMDAMYEVQMASDYEWIVRHQGLRLDLATGNYYNRMREYSPILGRFFQVDPLRFAAGDVNLYRYVGNTPPNINDYFGLTPSLSYDTVYQDKGRFGAYSWAIRWTPTSDPTIKGCNHGVVLQFVNVTDVTQTRNGRAETMTVRNYTNTKDLVVSKLRFWEAWIFDGKGNTKSYTTIGRTVAAFYNREPRYFRNPGQDSYTKIADQRIHDLFQLFGAIGTSGGYTVNARAYFVQCMDQSDLNKLHFSKGQGGSGGLLSLNVYNDDSPDNRPLQDNIQRMDTFMRKYKDHISEPVERAYRITWIANGDTTVNIIKGMTS